MASRLKSFVAGRVRRARRAMREQGLDALIVTNPRDVSYLTGFGGDDSVLVLTERGKVLLTDSRFTVQAKKECPSLRLVVRDGETMADAVAALLGKGRDKRRKLVAAVEADQVTVREHRAYRKALRGGLRTVEPVIAALREVKDEWEVRQIRRAVRVAQEAAKAMLADLRVGQTEREVAARLEYEMSRRGSTEGAFTSIVAVGAHAAEPHAIPGGAKVRRNVGLLVDWGATVGGYRSDLTRCWVPGRIPATFSEAYRWVLESQHAAVKAVRPGATLGEVDAAARNVMARSGWPVYGHGTGHGIGLDIHEAPRIKQGSEQRLRQGMVVTIEPGVYCAGRFGIRIEDDVLVGSRGAVVLSDLGRELEAVAIQGDGRRE